MFVDTVVYNLCINKSIQAQLDLPFVEKRKGQITISFIEEYDVVGPVVLKFIN